MAKKAKRLERWFITLPRIERQHCDCLEDCILFEFHYATNLWPELFYDPIQEPLINEQELLTNEPPFPWLG